mgnify:FL=1
MPRSYVQLLFCFFLVFSGLAFGVDSSKATLPGKPVPALSTYRLASGDVISIQVFGEEDLSREKIRLSDAGTISYPVLGEIRVLGITAGELEQFIADGLRGKYLVNPKVSVSIQEYRQFYVNGQVEKPGGYSYIPGLTVRKAISLAGGFKERADTGKIFIIHDTDSSQKPVSVDQSSSVLPGDIITVEESFF